MSTTLLDVADAAPLELSPASGGRLRLLITGGACLAVILAIVAAVAALGTDGLRPNLLARAQPPSLTHAFGTDLLGRDMLTRTLSGLVLSLRVGLLAAGASSIIALILALAATTLGQWADRAVGVAIDAVLSLPHLVLLILVSFALGGGVFGVVVAVAVSHWPRLTRILRAEILAVLSSDYVSAARGFGRSRWHIALRHLVPHLWPQFCVGLVLLFPHAILHEAALTFVGFGIDPGRPAIGVLLAEAMRTLTAGHWWLALFPGAGLLALVLAFDGVASGLRAIVDPRSAHD